MPQSVMRKRNVQTVHINFAETSPTWQQHPLHPPSQQPPCTVGTFSSCSQHYDCLWSRAWSVSDTPKRIQCNYFQDLFFLHSNLRENTSQGVFLFPWKLLHQLLQDLIEVERSRLLLNRTDHTLIGAEIHLCCWTTCNLNQSCLALV